VVIVELGTGSELLMATEIYPKTTASGWKCGIMFRLKIEAHKTSFDVRKRGIYYEHSPSIRHIGTSAKGLFFTNYLLIHQRPDTGKALSGHQHVCRQR
jgi:hypothetical protein